MRLTFISFLLFAFSIPASADRVSVRGKIEAGVSITRGQSAPRARAGNRSQRTRRAVRRRGNRSQANRRRANRRRANRRVRRVVRPMSSTIVYGAPLYDPYAPVYRDRNPHAQVYNPYAPYYPEEQRRQQKVVPRFGIGVSAGSLTYEERYSDVNHEGADVSINAKIRLDNRGLFWLQGEMGAMELDNYELESRGKFGLFGVIDLLPESNLRLQGILGAGFIETNEYDYSEDASVFAELGAGIGYRFKLGGMSMDLMFEGRMGEVSRSDDSVATPYYGDGYGGGRGETSVYYAPEPYQYATYKLGLSLLF